MDKKNYSLDDILNEYTVPERKYTQKIEYSDDYTELRTGEGGHGNFSDKLESADLYFKSDRYVIEGDATHSKAYSPELETDSRRIDHSAGKRQLNDILDEYASDRRPSFLHTISTTYHKAITGFFTRILPKTAEMPTASELMTDTEKETPETPKVPKTPKMPVISDMPQMPITPQMPLSPENAVDPKAAFEEASKQTPPPPPSKSEKAGLVSKTDLYSDAGRRHAPKKYRSEPQYRGNIADLNLGHKLGSKLMPDTGVLDDAESAKLQELAKRREERIKSFRLVGSEDEYDEEEAIAENSGDNKSRGNNNSSAGFSGDFESYDDTRRVAAELTRIRKNYVISALILFICAAAGFALAIINDSLGMKTPELLSKIQSTTVFLVTNAIIGTIAAIAAWSTVNGGLSKLLCGKPDADTLPALTLFLSLLMSCAVFGDPNMVKQGYVQIMVPVAVAALFFNAVGKIMLMRRAKRNFRIFSGARSKYAVFSVQDAETVGTLIRGSMTDTPNLAAFAETEFASGFIRKTFEPDVTDRFAKRAMPAVLSVSAVLGIIAAFLSYKEIGMSCVFAGFSVFITAIAVASGFITLLIVNSPAGSESVKLNAKGAVLLGFEGAEEFADTSAVLIDAKSLFPHGSIALLGVKLFSDTRLDEAIVEAASLSHQAGSIINTMFYDIIRGKNDLLSPVESYIYEDSMGLCGWINNRRVLLGNRELMINHSINGLPSEKKEAEYTGKSKSAVYLSISGELSAMFIIDLIPNIEIADALLEMQKKGVTILLRTVDSVLSISKLSDMFDISPEYIRLLPFRLTEQFDAVTAYRPSITANAVGGGDVGGIAAVFSSAKRIRASALTGLTLQLIAMILGAVFILAMLIFGSMREMSVTTVAAYNMVFVMILALVHSVGRLL